MSTEDAGGEAAVAARRRRGRSGAAAVVVFGLALALPAPGARADERPRVSFLGTETAGPEAAPAQLLDDAVIRGLRRADIAFLPIDPAKVPRTPDGLLCAGPACLAQATSATGARYIVRAEARGRGPAKGSYQGKIQVFVAQPYQVIGSDNFVCDGCAPDALAERFEERASVAMTKVLSSRQQVAPLVKVDAPEPDSQPGRAGPWVVGVTGAGLLGGGIYLVARGAQSTCERADASQCGRTYSDRTTGLLLGGLGAAAIAAAVIWAWPTRAAPSGDGGTRVSALSVGPGGISLGGVF